MDINLEGLGRVARSAFSLLSHVHTIIDITQATLGHGVSEDAHKVAKFIDKVNNGGKGTIEDEIAYERLEMEHLTSEERLILEEFRQMKRASFGADTKSENVYKDWDNDFRQSVLKRRVPGRSKTATKTVKKKDGTVTTTEDDKSTPASNQPAIDFLKRFTAHIKTARDPWKSRKKRREAGFIAGEKYLSNYNLPSDRPSALGQQLKDMGASIPLHLKRATEKMRSGVVKNINKLDDWIQKEHIALPVETSTNYAPDSPHLRARADR